jgi:hypothetical protein
VQTTCLLPCTGPPIRVVSPPTRPRGTSHHSAVDGAPTGRCRQRNRAADQKPYSSGPWDSVGSPTQSRGSEPRLLPSQCSADRLSGDSGLPVRRGLHDASAPAPPPPPPLRPSAQQAPGGTKALLNTTATAVESTRLWQSSRQIRADISTTGCTCWQPWLSAIRNERDADY